MAVARPERRLGPEKIQAHVAEKAGAGVRVLSGPRRREHFPPKRNAPLLLGAVYLSPGTLRHPGRRELPQNSGGRRNEWSAAKFTLPLGFARLLKQAKPVFGLLTTGQPCPPFPPADGQTGKPGGSLPGVNPRRSR